MTLERGKTPENFRVPEPEVDQLIDTDWDTAPQELAFLSAGIDYFSPMGRNKENLMRLLTCGVDESWFIDENRRYIFLGLFNASMMIDTPGVTVRIGAIIEEAEKASGEKGWAEKEIRRIINEVPVFKLKDFLEEDIPLWWHKLKKPKVISILGRLNMLLAHLPPTIERLEEIDRLAVNAVDTWRASPLSVDFEETWIDRLRDECLKPIPSDYKISTGLQVFDELLNGGIGGPKAPDAGRLIIACGRPGMGKTMVASNIAVRIAARGWKVGFWSFEMARDQIGLRIIANIDYFNCRKNGGEPITYKNLQDRNYTPDQRERLRLSKYKEIQLNTKVFIGNSSMTAQYVCNHMKAFARKYPETRLFVIDHLGLLNIPAANRAVAVGEATREIKTTATELGVDVLLLCQLNRNVEGRNDKRPNLSDLRDSGRVEEDADVVIGFHRPAYYDPEDESLANVFEVISLKNRQGNSGYTAECSAYFDSCALADSGSTSGIEPEEEEDNL